MLVFTEQFSEQDRRQLEKYLITWTSSTARERDPAVKMYRRPWMHALAGWYNGFYFRSLGELAYMIEVFEKNNRKWETAEKPEFAVPYRRPDGTSHLYIPDFFLPDEKIIVECKGIQEMKNAVVLLKSAAAEKQFIKQDLIYVMDSSPDPLPWLKINTLYDTGNVIFTPECEPGYLKRSKRYRKLSYAA